MFMKHDQHRRGRLDKVQFQYLLKKFSIFLDEDELFLTFSEVDGNQDGYISYWELYKTLITDSIR